MKLKEKIPELIKRSKMPDHGEIVRREVDKALATKSERVAASLERLGLLERLGKFANPTVKDQVELLREILPYSVEFLHVSDVQTLSCL